MSLGVRLEAELRDQPRVWDQIAGSSKARDLAAAIGGRDVVFVGSGSSLFAGMLGALALRRRGVTAYALAATEAMFDHAAYHDAAIVAISQSGKSADLLRALDILAPQHLIALTNSGSSPLAERANSVISFDAGPEVAIPATKSVTASVAIVLWAAGLIAGKSARSAATLRETARDVQTWLDGDGPRQTAVAAARIARRSSVIVAGAGYGVPIAYELALKMKEASYMHAEGFAAGEFRHGSAAMLDASRAIIGIVDDASRDIVARPLAEAERSECLRYTIGACVGEIELLGPQTGEAFNTLSWLVAGQMLALELGRVRSIDSDAPRGLTKFVV